VSSLKTAFPLAVWGVTLNLVLYLEIRAYLYYKNVLETLLGIAEPHTDGRDGRKSVEIIQAIYMSAKTGKKVSLPLNM